MCCSATFRRALLLTIAGFVLIPALSPLGGTGVLAQSKKKGGGSEAFRAKAKLTTEAGGADALVRIEIDQYTPERDLKTMEEALQTNGSGAFLDALRRAPIAGRFRMGDQTFTIRWARQRPTAKGRVISLVTDSPVYFVGGGLPGAKPRTGFDVAVVQLNMDSAGVGEGSLAAAARVKPGGATGVEVEEYAGTPLKLVSVYRIIS
jgi:hypothetical protein